MNKVSGTDRASNFVIGNDEQMENFIGKQTDETFQLFGSKFVEKDKCIHIRVSRNVNGETYVESDIQSVIYCDRTNK